MSWVNTYFWHKVDMAKLLSRISVPQTLGNVKAFSKPVPGGMVRLSSGLIQMLSVCAECTDDIFLPDDYRLALLSYRYPLQELDNLPPIQWCAINSPPCSAVNNECPEFLDCLCISTKAHDPPDFSLVSMSQFFLRFHCLSQVNPKAMQFWAASC